MVNAPEGFNQVFFLKHLFNGRKMNSSKSCYEMSFNPMMYHDEIRCHSTSGCSADLSGSSRNKVDKFRINQKKIAPTYCAEGTKWTNSE